MRFCTAGLIWTFSLLGNPDSESPTAFRQRIEHAHVFAACSCLCRHIHRPMKNTSLETFVPVLLLFPFDILQLTPSRESSLSRVSSGMIKCPTFPSKSLSFSSYQTPELIARGPLGAHDLRCSWEAAGLWCTRVLFFLLGIVLCLHDVFEHIPQPQTHKLQNILGFQRWQALTQNFKTSSYLGQREEWPLSGAFQSKYVSPLK